jgi:hypothetical protein
MAFVKLAPVSVHPASDTPDWIVAPTNDVPVKSFPARFPVSVCPASDATIDTVNVLLSTVALLYVEVAAWVALKITLPTETGVMTPLLTLMVATPGLRLVYVMAPALALLGAVVIENGASTLVFAEGTTNAADENPDVPSATVSVLLSRVALAYMDVAAWVALKVTSPAVTIVITPVLSLMVATPGVRLVYVMAPVLALLGAVVIDNVPVPYVPDEGTVNVADENADVASDTVNVLLSTVALAYVDVSAWVALKITLPAETSVMTPLFALMVATPGLRLVYVIAPSLALLGAVVIENDASTMVFELGTVNVDSVGLMRTGTIVSAATPYPRLLKVDVPSPVHVMPSVEYAIRFVVPSPTATHRLNCALYATSNPLLVKIDAPSPVHVIPSVEYAILFVPPPTATHRLNCVLYATPYP